MKYKVLPVLLAIITSAAMLCSCGSGEQSKATADEAVNRVYPEGEGRLYNGTQDSTTASVPASTEYASAAATQSATKKPESARKKAKDKQNSENGTQPTTITANVPKDNITGSNINPNISAIQGQMASQINSLAVKSISLSETSVTIELGESKEISVSFNPGNAAIKTCSLSLSNSNVSATMSGKTVKISGKNAGTSRLTVTSYNGHKAVCNITVKRAEQTITDDTVLSHAELCTLANANRWCAAVTLKLQTLGMQQSPSLHGSSFTLNTTDYKGNMSYKEAESAFVTAAEDNAKSLTNGDWSQYEFYCSVLTKDKGEYAISVAINKLEDE